ncbi:MAG: uL22 family ribosomal protein [Candidatus Shikimatogenerans bostrichidophilus]|nr:MAG: uL22 family ribosomal protein [Candidatus Shikimatogenerans bostrichidophilus]
MGKRKRIYSERIKRNNKKIVTSILKKVRISPKKIRAAVYLIKGKNIFYVLNLLDNFLSYKLSIIFKKIINSAINNYINKYGKIYNKNLYIKNIIVNSNGYYKRVRYAPMGRSNEIKKRLSYIKLIIKIKKNGSKSKSNS